MNPKPRTKTNNEGKEGTPEVQPREHATRIKAVTSELNQKLVGAFVVRSASLTTEWIGPISNRQPDLVAVNKLVDSLRCIGVQRTVSEHHMLGALDSKVIRSMLQHMDMTKDKIQQMNSRGEFPEIPQQWLDKKDIKIELEAGQHRLLALEKLYPDEPTQQWWVMKLFELPLSNHCMDHLRANDLFYMTPLSDGDRFLHCYNYHDLMKTCDKSEEGTNLRTM
jgi:Protein of unknown function (DUF3723)